MAVRLADQANVFFQQRKFSESWQFFQKALAQESYLSNIIRVQMLALANNQREIFNTLPEFNNFQRQLVSLLPANHQSEPYNSYQYLVFGIYYGHLAEIWPEFLSKAEVSFQHTAELAPRKGETYWQWGNMYGRIGDIATAKVKYDIALDLEPSNTIINYQVGKWYLAIQGDLERGYALIQKALDDGYMPRMDDIKPVAQFLEERGRLKQVEQIYQTLIANNRIYSDLDLAQAELAEFYQRRPELL